MAKGHEVGCVVLRDRVLEHGYAPVHACNPIHAPGLMEQLSIGIIPRCIKVTERPMARGASVGMWKTSSPRSVSMAQKTVKTRTKVPVLHERMGSWVGG